MTRVCNFVPFQILVTSNSMSTKIIYLIILENSETALSDDISESIKWLENCVEPWSKVCENWEKTHTARKGILKNCTDIQTYFDQFACLKHALGYSLVREFL